MKGRVSVMLGVVCGLLAGAAGHYLASPLAVAEPRLGKDYLEGSPVEDPQIDRRAAPPSRPRPTLEEVLMARGFHQQVLMGRYLNEATIDEVLDLLERSFDRKAGQQIWPVISIIYQRGVALDPDAVVALIAERDVQGYRVEVVFREWAKIDIDGALVASAGHFKRVREAVLHMLSESDPERALALIEEEGIGDQYLRARIRAQQIEDLLETDPQVAQAHALSLTNTLERTSAISSLVTAWAKKDPVATLAWIQNAEDIPDRGRLLERILPDLVESHPGKVREVLESMSLSSSKGRLEGRVLQRLAKKDFESALSQVRSHPSGSYRDYLFSQIVNRSNPPENLLALIDELGVDTGGSRRLTSMEIKMENGSSSSSSGSDNVRDAVQVALTRLAQDSPQEALSRAYGIFGNDHEGEFRQLSKTLLTQWAAKDPVAAADWALELPESQLATNMQVASIGSWVRSDPAAAAAALGEREALANPQVRKEVAGAWSRRDPASLLSWAESLPAEGRGEMLTDAVTEVAKHAPELAIEHVEGIESAEQRASAVQEIGQTWASKAPQEALSWLQTQPEEMDVSRTVRNAAKAWVLETPLEASQWIGALEPGSRRDQAVAGMVHALVSSNNAQRDFDSARVWVETIADPELKTTWTEEIETRQAKETPTVEAPESGVLFERFIEIN